MRRTPAFAVLPFVTLCASLTLGACAHGSADRSQSRGLPAANLPAISQVPVTGARVTVETGAWTLQRGGGRVVWKEIAGVEHEVQGELLAASADTLWVAVDNKPLPIPCSRVREVRIPRDGESALGLGLWTLGGTLSTCTHGVCLVVTAPIWLVVGGVTTTAALIATQDLVLQASDSRLSQFARYPAGMPRTEALDTNDHVDDDPAASAPSGLTPIVPRDRDAVPAPTEEAPVPGEPSPVPAEEPLEATPAEDAPKLDEGAPGDTPTAAEDPSATPELT